MFSTLLNLRNALVASSKPLVNRAFIQNVGYKSSISLDKLYPKSNHDPLAKPDLAFLDNKEKFSGFIPIEKLKVNYQRSSKPGGQHANKTESNVEIRFHVESSDWIPKWIREKLMEKHINRINKEGYLIVRSEKTRKALLNQADCLEKIRAMIFEASIVPRGLDAEELAKIETDKKIADGKRLVMKQKRSEKKAYRKSATPYDSHFDYYYLK